MKTYEVFRPDGDGDHAAMARVIAQVFGADETKVAASLAKSPADALRVVATGGRIVGALKWYALGQWFGGRCVPCDGIAAVAIDPLVRGGGAARALLGHTLRERAGAGVATSALYPSTVPLYRSLGWAVAGVRERLELPLAGLSTDGGDLPLHEIVPGDFGDLEAAQERFARGRSGLLRRDALLWERVRMVDDRPVRHFAVRGPEGDVDAYASVKPFEIGSMAGHFELTDCAVNTGPAGRRLLAFLQTYGTLASQVVLHGSMRHPLVGLAAHGRVAMRLAMPWMVRLVNVPAALEARGYPRDLSAELHLEVVDDVVPSNGRRLVLELVQGLARVSEGGQGLLRVDVRGLAALYTGFQNAHEVASLGWLSGAQSDRDALGAAFAAPSPWMIDFF